MTKWMSDRVTKWLSDHVTEWPSDHVTKLHSDRVTGSFADDWPDGIFFYYYNICYNGGQVVVGGWMGLYSKNTNALLLMVACLGTRGIIISGGKEAVGATTPRTSVELLYGNGSSCWLPDLPEGRWSHSQSGLVICGGGYKRTLLFLDAKHLYM